MKYFSLKTLAELTESSLVGNPDHEIYGVADLETAGPCDASFFSNQKYKQALNHSKAGVLFIDSKVHCDGEKNYLISDNPSKAFQILIDLLHPPRKTPSGFEGIHPTAVIHPTARVGHNVTIGPYAVLDEHVEIGESTFIGASVYIGPRSTIGSFCTIHPHAVIREECKIGNRVIIQPGAIIGSCGYGYITDAQGRHTKLNQVGNVQIEDDVEIGANSTIDRARFKSTKIGIGTKIDNLVQIGHGVRLGKYNLIVAQTGIAGSTTTGTNVVLAGHVGVSGHLHLGDRVVVTAFSGVSKSLSEGKYGGIPAIPLEEHNRNHVYLRNIEKYIELIKQLIKK